MARSPSFGASPTGANRWRSCPIRHNGRRWWPGAWPGLGLTTPFIKRWSPPAVRHMTTCAAGWTAFHADLGPRVFETGPDRFPNLLDDTAFTAVDRIEDADLLLNTGPNEPLETVADYRVLLDHALARNLPMICANPDLHVYVGHEIQVCAGSLAADYQSRGGTVRYHGKPHAGVFETVTARLPAAGNALSDGGG